MVEKQELIQALQSSIIEIYAEHGEMLERGVHEEAINFHLAGYLFNELNIIEKDIHLDIEYNKNQDDPKDLEIPSQVQEDAEEELPQFEVTDDTIDDLTNDQGADLRPDIIIHKRGTHDSNIFIAEIKKSAADLDIKDVAKPLCLTHPRTEYDYDFGAVIPLEKQFLQDSGLYWIENGNLEHNMPINLP